MSLPRLKTSGLRGRGGAGFPTWLKWTFARQAAGDQKYVVCNGDEGDPGAFMNRRVLEGDPHAVLEGMAIAAYVVGANQGYFYVRAEYPIAIRTLRIAIEQAREYGLLGQNIFGTDFSFDLEVRMGAGAFVCGEETALMQSIEGNRGQPRTRPPFPAVSGLWGKPTNINNVETYANVPQILLRGGEWFASMGTEKSKGTKTFAIAGKVKRTGSDRSAAGHHGPRDCLRCRRRRAGRQGLQSRPDRRASGWLYSRKSIWTCRSTMSPWRPSVPRWGPVASSLWMKRRAWSDIARFFMEFAQEESCGKCVPCRVGTRQMLEILEGICGGKGEAGRY